MSNNTEILPREFGKYHLIERVAAGGMAELYRAKLYGAGGFEKDLAIKKVLPHLSSDEGFIQMFMDEAMITVTLNHGNIVSVIDFGELDGDFFLVMEFVDGVDLQSLVKKSTDLGEAMPPHLACFIAQQMAKGLEYAHHKKGNDGNSLEIVHRDISPQNVLVSFEGQVKIVDFGIARAASRITSTQAGVVKGKLAYISPEQIGGEIVDQRADIYSVGVTLYEMLANRRPYEGNSPHHTLAMIAQGNFEKLHKVNKRVDKKLSAIVNKALDKNIKKRYQTAGEMAVDLSGYLYRSGNVPTAVDLAKFVQERLPDQKPRTIHPTPIRPVHTERTQPSATPLPVHTPVDQGTDKAQSGTLFMYTPAGQELVSPPPASTPAPVEAGSPIEAVSATMLGLPKFEQASTTTAPAPAPAVEESQPEPADPGGAIKAAESLLLSEPQTEAPAQAHSDPASASQHMYPAASAPSAILETGFDPQREPTPESQSAVIRIGLADKKEEQQTPVEAEPKDQPSEPTEAKEPLADTTAPSTPAVVDQTTGSLTAAAFPKQKSNLKLFAIGGVFILGLGLLWALLLGPSLEEPNEPTPTPAVGTKPIRPLTPIGQNPIETGSKEKKDDIAAGAPIPDHSQKKKPVVEKPPTPAKKKNLATKKKVAKKVGKTKPKKVAGIKKRGKRTGTVRINSEPFSVVYLGRRRIGPTPQMNLKLPVGSHTLTLKNEALGLTKRVRVKVEAKKVHTVFVDLNEK